MKAVYLAGPYRASTPEGIRANKERVVNIARLLSRQGVLPVVPHLAQAYLSDELEDWSTALYLGLKLLERCDVLLVCGEHSEGVKDEIAFAVGQGIPVFHWSEYDPYDDEKKAQFAAMDIRKEGGSE